MKHHKNMVVRNLNRCVEFETSARTISFNYSASDVILMTVTRTAFTDKSITTPLYHDEAVELLHGLQQAIEHLWPEET